MYKVRQIERKKEDEESQQLQAGKKKQKQAAAARSTSVRAEIGWLSNENAAMRVKSGAG
jgi:hypothetical protein